MMKKSFLYIYLLIISSAFVFSSNTGFIKNEQVVLETKENNFIQQLMSFFVSDENNVYILDFKAGNLKVFNSKGKFLKNIGRKGLGPGEFVHLRSSAYKKGEFTVYDSRTKKLINYKIKKNNEIELIKKEKFFNHIVDLKFIGNNLLMAGIFVKKNRVKFLKPTFYTSCIYDINTKKYNYLFSLAYCNDFKPGELYKKSVSERIFALPMGGYIDSSDDYIFYVKESELKIFRINRKTNKKIFFGNKTKNYIEPVANSELLKALSVRDDKKLKILHQDMSLLKGIFVVNKKTLGVLFTKYIKKSDSTDVYIQFYNTSGKFINEELLLHAKSFFSEGITSYFQKSKSTLYILDTSIKEDFDQDFILNKFSIKL